MHADLAAEMIGPDFLQNLSEKQLASGLETDATVLRANARAWNIDRATILERDRTIALQARELDRMRSGMAAIGKGAGVIADAAGKAAHA